MKHERKFSCLLCLLLAAALLLSVFAGCSKSESNTSDPKSNEGTLSSGNDNKQNDVQANPSESERSPEVTEKTPAVPSSEPDAPTVVSGGFEGRDDIKYVLIYNPDVYHEYYNYNPTMFTGEIGNEIDVSMFRADELEPFQPEFIPYTQPNLNELLQDANLDFDGDRAGVIQPIFQEGDTRTFNVDLYGSDYRQEADFTCLYVGEHCCVWSYSYSISYSDAKLIADEFDGRIYETDVSLFGQPRYADDDGKIHLLYYPLDDYTLGFFSALDLFTSAELANDYSWVSKYMPNADLAVIHFNSYAVSPQNMDMVLSTTAHEFQHLINGTNFIESPHEDNNYYSNGTWINEAMSGYVEELLYPNVKEAEGHYLCFEQSPLIRHGQSMFNFNTVYYRDPNNPKTAESDFGVYGSVFLFSNYLEQNAGESVFSKMHNYWRYTPNYAWDDAEAIYTSVPKDFISEIDNAYVYSGDVRFNTQEQEWMSKMILDFYLSLLQSPSDGPAVFHNVESQLLLYDEINPADIEGGGRVVAATADGTFEIPEDADYGLIYVGLDENFRPITDLIYK